MIPSFPLTAKECLARITVALRKEQKAAERECMGHVLFE